MRKTNLNTYMTFTIVFLFLSVIVFSPALAAAEQSINEISEKEHNKSGTITFWRSYYFGKISNLTKVNDSYRFLSNNMRCFEFHRDASKTWEISYIHYRDGWRFMIRGFHFRGILTSTFIWGFFYV
jgi:hypothetical protein